MPFPVIPTAVFTGAATLIGKYFQMESQNFRKKVDQHNTEREQAVSFYKEMSLKLDAYYLHAVEFAWTVTEGLDFPDPELSEDIVAEPMGDMEAGARTLEAFSIDTGGTQQAAARTPDREAERAKRWDTYHAAYINWKAAENYAYAMMLRYFGTQNANRFQEKILKQIDALNRQLSEAWYANKKIELAEYESFQNKLRDDIRLLNIALIANIQQNKFGILREDVKVDQKNDAQL